MTDAQRPSRMLCVKPLATGRECGRPARFQVNGALSCQRHLHGSIIHHSTLNESGHLWASVQVLPTEKASS